MNLENSKMVTNFFHDQARWLLEQVQTLKRFMSTLYECNEMLNYSNKSSHKQIRVRVFLKQIETLDKLDEINLFLLHV